ncbi:MAG TPA: dihydroorotate dehydrogenase electron transfer subunit [Myxococcales bacterium]|jgi:dihydroorotate dehydrogenase electron transfer subunit
MANDRAKMRTQPVLEVVCHAPGLKSLYFEKPFEAEPGQFVNLWVPGVDEKPFSVSDLSGGRMEISVKAYGAFSTRLLEAKPGDFLGIRGPFGKGFELEADGLLVAGGIGLAPIRFLSKRLQAAGLEHRTVIGLRSRADLIFPDEYASGADLMSEDGSVGGKGLVTGRLEAMLAERRPRVVYGAGPEKMLLAVRDLADRFQVPFQLSFERYMKCGFGLCGQCCLDGEGLRVCCEGPVFNREDLAKITELGKPHRTASGRRPAGS